MEEATLQITREENVEGGEAAEVNAEIPRERRAPQLKEGNGENANTGEGGLGETGGWRGAGETAPVW